VTAQQIGELRLPLSAAEYYWTFPLKFSI
jgi:hypothetical protein